MRLLVLSAALGALAWGLGFTPTVHAANDATNPDKPALITVNVPADAQIWFDGAKTSEEGPRRQFLSPPLTPGHNYSYTLHVRRTENGRNVEETRKVRVHAGDQINLSFGSSPTLVPAYPNGDLYRNQAPGYRSGYDGGYYPGYSPRYSGPSEPAWYPYDPVERRSWGLVNID